MTKKDVTEKIAEAVDNLMENIHRPELMRKNIPNYEKGNEIK